MSRSTNAPTVLTRKELLQQATSTNKSVLLGGQPDQSVHQMMNNPTYTEFVCVVSEDEINVLQAV